MRDSDAEALFGIYSDPNVTRFLGRPVWTSVDQGLKRIRESVELWEKNRNLRLGVALKESDKIIGECCLFNASEKDRRVEIGYVLAYDAWGKGYMNEALVALVNYAFTEMNFHRIEAEIDPSNLASAKALERLGFQKEGHLRERWIADGEVSDSGLYGLLEGDWKARQSAASALTPC